MIRRRKLCSWSVASIALVSIADKVHAQLGAEWLIEPVERHQSSRAFEALQLSRAIIKESDVVGTNPLIEIVTPGANQRIVSPVDFSIRFQSPTAPIDEGSIRIYYGYMNIDITGRLRSFGARIDSDGIELVGAPLQPDSYRVSVEVANVRGDRARRTVWFHVD